MDIQIRIRTISSSSSSMDIPICKAEGINSISSVRTWRVIPFIEMRVWGSRTSKDLCQMLIKTFTRKSKMARCWPSPNAHFTATNTFSATTIVFSLSKRGKSSSTRRPWARPREWVLDSLFLSMSRCLCSRVRIMVGHDSQDRHARWVFALWAWEAFGSSSIRIRRISWMHFRRSTLMTTPTRSLSITIKSRELCCRRARPTASSTCKANNNLSTTTTLVCKVDLVKTRSNSKEYLSITQVHLEWISSSNRSKRAPVLAASVARKISPRSRTFSEAMLIIKENKKPSKVMKISSGDELMGKGLSSEHL